MTLLTSILYLAKCTSVKFGCKLTRLPAWQCLVVDSTGGEGEWAENRGYRGDSGRITVLELKVHLFPVEKL